MNIFKDHPVEITYTRRLLSSAIWMKFYNGHVINKPKLSEYFQMHRC